MGRNKVTETDRDDDKLTRKQARKRLDAYENRSLFYGNRKLWFSKKIGGIFIFLGAILVISAIALIVFNQVENETVETASDSVVVAFQENLEERRDEITGEVPEYAAVDTILIDGDAYIGVLSIPKFGLDLPIMEQWSYEGMKIAPGRYAGNLATSDLVIAGHNYDRHFGNLKNLEEGDTVIFTNVNGEEFTYVVEENTVLEATAVKEMQSGGWDLTLFTCTYSGQARVTVRCRLQN